MGRPRAAQQVTAGQARGRQVDASAAGAPAQEHVKTIGKRSQGQTCRCEVMQHERRHRRPSTTPARMPLRCQTQ